jgi:hypothetical protein
LALAAGGGGGLIAMAAVRAQVLSHAGPGGVLSDDAAAAAAGAGWDALAGGLEQWLAIVGLAGWPWWEAPSWPRHAWTEPRPSGTPSTLWPEAGCHEPSACCAASASLWSVH